MELEWVVAFGSTVLDSKDNVGIERVVLNNFVPQELLLVFLDLLQDTAQREQVCKSFFTLVDTGEVGVHHDELH